MRASQLPLCPALRGQVSIVPRRRSLFRMGVCSSPACLAWAVASQMFNIRLSKQMILVTSMNSEMTAGVSWVLERERRALERDAIKIYSLMGVFITFIWNTTQILIWGLGNKLLISYFNVINIVGKKVCRKHRTQPVCYFKDAKSHGFKEFTLPMLIQKWRKREWEGVQIWTGKHLHQNWLWNNLSFW